MSLFKLATRFVFKHSFELLKLGASDVFNILGLTPTLKQIEQIATSKNLDTTQTNLLAQNRFNQLVGPYLKMQPVNLSLKSDLEFFLHDLIHEALKEGSIARFNTLDKQAPSPTRYSLQDYMDEDIAEFLSSTSMEGGLLVYVEYLKERISPETNSVQDLSYQLDKIISKDIEAVKNVGQQKFLKSFKKSLLFNIIKSSEIAESLSNNNLSRAFSIIEGYTKNYVNSKLQNVSVIDNELIASLLRRWLLAIKKDLEAISAPKIKHHLVIEDDDEK